MACLRKPLPSTFRISGSGKFAKVVRDTLRNHFVSAIARLDPAEADGETIQPPVPLPWCVVTRDGCTLLETLTLFPPARRYPDDLAWQMNYSRTQLRRLAPLAGLHEWLVAANTYGSITRQEAVSMLPPLFLDVEPHHCVLDMCAAPGSKTSQLVEALHGSGEGGALPPGVVLANDADLQRCNMLVHQLKRAASPALLVVNHDASQLPAPKGAAGHALSFDRVLADVPCTGDGTLRKAPDMWRKWNSGMALALHTLQINIAKRGAALLKVGGRMVYSTCSMNPLENEAVVAALLQWGGGALRLVDTSAQLPALRRAPGLLSWSVMDRTGVRSSCEPDGGGKQKVLLGSLFPPTLQEAQLMGLQHCIRILPHHGDTGAFFVALLEKTSELPAQQSERPAAATAATAATAAAPDADAAAAPAAPQSEAPARAPPRCPVDPVTPVTDEAMIDVLESFYGLAASFPLRGALMVRTGDGDGSRPRRLYGVSSGAAALLASDTRRRLKVMSAGVKLFERGHDPLSRSTGAAEEAAVPVALPAQSCPYRIAQEGLRWLLPHVTRQKVHLPVAELAHLVRRRTLYYGTPDNVEHPATFGAQSQAALAPFHQGCLILVPILPDGAVAAAAAGRDVSTPEDLACVAWKGKVSLAILVNKDESKVLQEKLDLFLEAEELDMQLRECARAAQAATGAKKAAPVAETEAAA